ncbi:hypothetical protein LPW41_11725 [Microbacterium sp. JC 701]|uniref:hypothetical protein n=1 Tax=Microbacterium sp. JC 701 TaxID=2897389 RepID=UPI001E61C145|nr:hypothetical protein [Microbacterium sp. JC 701]MCD2170366.1 hypothetical protein [Microbacterium sp. JC 701]
MPEPRTITVEQARSAVLASGQLAAIDGPYFLAAADAEWRDVHIADAPPVAARVIITRRDQAPRKITIGWAEYEAQEQTDPEWNATRAAKPMTIFGSEVERHAYRAVFADILAPLLAATPAAPADGPAPWETTVAPERDWAADIDTAADVEALDVVVREARAARVFKPTPEGTALDRAWKARRKVLAEAADVDAWAPAPGPSDAAQGPATPERLDELNAIATRTRPLDHLPTNRAGRRAQKRKGHRRGR